MQKKKKYKATGKNTQEPLVISNNWILNLPGYPGVNHQSPKHGDEQLSSLHEHLLMSNYALLIFRSSYINGNLRPNVTIFY
jgi:hypothetical protein